MPSILVPGDRRVVTGIDAAMTWALTAASPSLALIPPPADPALERAVLITPARPATAYVPLALDPFARASLIPPASLPEPRLPRLQGYARYPEPGPLRWALPAPHFETLRIVLAEERERSPSLYRSELVSRDFSAVRTGNAKRNPRMMAGVTLYLIVDDTLALRWALAGPIGRALGRIYDAADGDIE